MHTNVVKAVVNKFDKFTPKKSEFKIRSSPCKLLKDDMRIDRKAALPFKHMLNARGI